jgi:hypothetical protein
MSLELSDFEFFITRSNPIKLSKHFIVQQFVKVYIYLTKTRKS